MPGSRDTEAEHDGGIPPVPETDVEGVFHEVVLLHTCAHEPLILKHIPVDSV